MRRMLLLPTLLVLLAAPAAAQVAATEYDGAAALGLTLRSLGTTKRVLMIGAHPDDEQTQVLSALALGQGAEVGYLSLTRGEGGQNGIGAELQEGLGLVRTEELLAARRLDGAQQFFTRAIDYGFSKNADEAFSQWPHEELLGDVVAVVRYFRPDVIVSVFSGTPRDGHGQHQAAGILASEAFEAAADSSRFPEHFSHGLRPHAVAHLYQISRDEAGEGVTLATGTLDPLLGRSYFQIAMASRSRHRSQDMGRVEAAGPQTTSLVKWESRAPDAAGRSLFAGVDTTLSSLARTLARRDSIADAGRLIDLLGRYQAQADDARRTFNPFQPDQVVFFLVEAHRQLDEAARLASAVGSGEAELRFRIVQEREKLAEAIRRAGRIELDATTDDETIAPGQTFTLDVTLWNGGNTPVQVSGMLPQLPATWSVAPLEGFSGTVAAGTLARQQFEISVPADAEFSQPYFLKEPREGALYRWPVDAGVVGIPFEAAGVGVLANVTVQGAPTTARTIATFRGVDARSGEFRRPVRVVPGISVVVEPRLAVLPLVRRAEPLNISVEVTAEELTGTSGTLTLQAPDGWRVQPTQVELDFHGAGEERVVEFTVYAPSSLSAGRETFRAIFTDAAGRSYDEGYTLVDYPHIDPRPLYREASLDVEVVDVEVPAVRVGYVAQNGDNVPLALAQMGIDVTLLTEEQLAAAPLTPFDVIVIGSRAYEGRPDLVTHNARLLDYVRGGGTMIVQYNQYQYSDGGMAPFDLSIARPHDRVTDENAEVRLLDPQHPVFNTPNKISEVDFEGWVQERGLYFLNSWDDEFTPLLEMADPGEAPNRGSLLIAQLGEGKYVYTGLALFRQFPAGVPGAYRLMANLLALGAD